MKYFYFYVLLFIALPLTSLEVTLKEWSYGPDIDRPYFKKGSQFMNPANKPWNISVYGDVVWYTDDDTLLFLSKKSGRIFEYEGKDKWYKFFSKFKNDYYEYLSPSPMIANISSGDKKNEYYYKVTPYFEKDAVEEYYKIEKTNNHFSNKEISKDEFTKGSREWIGRYSQSAQSNTTIIEDLRFDLDFGNYIMLVEADAAENDEITLEVYNKDNRLVFTLKSYYTDKLIGCPFFTRSGCFSLNGNKNKIALLLSHFPKVNQDALAILNIIYDGVINDSRVRLRSEPNLKSSTIKYLNQNDSVKILDRTTEKEKIDTMESHWYKVRLTDNTEGWVYGAFVTIE